MAISNVELTNTFDEWRQTTNSVITQLNALGTASTITISGGSIDGTTIGASSPSTGVFTTLTVSSSITLSGASLILDDNAISGDKISGGTIDNVTVQIAAAPTLASHATRKDYVDAEIEDLKQELIGIALLFGD